MVKCLFIEVSSYILKVYKTLAALCCLYKETELVSTWRETIVLVHSKYVVEHKSAKLLMTYAVGKLEAALNISHQILSTSSQRVS